ncbi:hypothetical protein SmJEL517_g00598 [Synchytrium microbalum]|uniref:Peroxisomal membrane protein PEX13 n=1 Tax=Synchytrium microbalum TaxID=1806994 RepID=A0A507C992_9FUNG|nr:uncharacterized protein SmJEL517_g00598 [Synchytrium microbalum]TPX37637.1 hypothetical protein SmJEL517_g00598 [Synchytrium microbalum]
MPSPPKPWERAGGAAGVNPTSTPSSAGPSSYTSTTTTNSMSTAGAPAVPARTGAVSTVSGLNRPAMPYGSTYGQSAYGSSYGASPYSSSYSSPYGSTYGSSYGGVGGYGSTMGSYGSTMGGYSSPYNRFGSSYGGASAYSSPYNRFGSMGGMGGGYSGYGSPYNRFGGAPGMPGQPEEISLTQRMEQSTQNAFMVLDNIVQAFGGFSQMLESTFHATHSSFMAMVGVAEQFGHLRNYLGQVLSIVALIRYVRDIGYRIVGKAPPANPAEISTDNFTKFEQTSQQSTRPLWLFASLVIGLPWLISRLISSLNNKRLESVAAGTGLPGTAGAPGEPGKDPNNPNVANPAGLIGPDGRPLTSSQIRQLEFCRGLYDFNGETPAELTFRKGDVIAILSKIDPATGMTGEWWRGRMQSGTIGMFPANYVEIIDKKTPSSSGMPPATTDSRAGNPALNPAAFAENNNTNTSINTPSLNPTDFTAQ